MHYEFRRGPVLTLAVLVLVWLAATRVEAQPTPSSTVMATPVATHVAYARYSPVACMLIASRMNLAAAGERRLTWLSRWPATAETKVSDSLYSDSVTKVASAHVRNCLRGHTIASTAPEYLVGLGMAWLSADDVDQANAAFAAAIRHTMRASMAEQGWLLQQIVTAYANGDTKYLPMALDYMKRLDALGDPAVGFRLTARNVLYTTAAGMDSLPFMAEQASAALQLSRTLTGDLRREWLSPCVQAILNQADLDMRRGSPQIALAALNKASEELAPLDHGLVNGMLGSPMWLAGFIGKEMPPLKATYAYLPGQTKLVDSVVRPTKGKVSILLKNSHVWLPMQAVQVLTIALDIMRTLGPAVEVSLLGEPSGHVGRAPIALEKELPMFPQFFHEYLKLNMPIIIYDRKVVGKREDGKLYREPNPNDIAYVVIVDKHGRIRHADNGINGLRWMHIASELAREP